MSNSSLVAPSTRSVLDALSSARWQASHSCLHARERHLAIQKGEQCIMRTSAQLLSMKGRRVLVTGAATGIGRAMALRFAEAGAELLLLQCEQSRHPCAHPSPGSRLRQARLPRERPGSRRHQNAGYTAAQEGGRETAGRRSHEDGLPLREQAGAGSVGRARRGGLCRAVSRF
jgi:hypothetical protein